MLSDRAMSTRGTGKPVDELDTLCKQYKECVFCAKQEFGDECIPERKKYKWQLSKGDVETKHESGTCLRSLFECDLMYATDLKRTNAIKSFNPDFHGFYTQTGFTFEKECKKREGKAEPKCCGGKSKPYYLYNKLNPNKKCCSDGTVQKDCKNKS